MQLGVSASVYSGDVKMYMKAQGKEHYDYDPPEGSEPVGVWGTPIVSPWAIPFSTDDVFYEGLAEALDVEPETIALYDGESALTVTDDWKECNLIIPSTEIEKKANNTGVYTFAITFSLGDGTTDPSNLGGFTYLLDDISIQDLNADVEYLGRTWKDPSSTGSEGEEEGGEGEEGGEA
jgi:hypothetical protein